MDYEWDRNEVSAVILATLVVLITTVMLGYKKRSECEGDAGKSR